MTMTVTTIQEYGVNRFYEAVPLEMLFSDAQSPSVQVIVDGIDALCINSNCDYAYIANAGSVTSQELSGKSVTVQGTDLPTTEVSLEFGGTECDSTTISTDGSTVTCDLIHFPAAGIWSVQLSGPNGKIAVDLSVADIEVSMQIDSISPSTDLNQNGGNIITVQGTGFPRVATDV